MKNTLISRISFAALLAVALGTLAVKTQAQDVISWNLDNNSTIQPTGAAGLVLATNWTDTWLNNVTVNLPDNHGNATTMDLAYGSPYGITYSIGGHPGQDADGSYNREMLNGYLNAGMAGWNPPSTNSFVTLSEIPYSQYDIYVYFSSDVANRIGNVTDGTTTYSFSTMGPAEVSGANALFTQTTDTSGSHPLADYAIFSGLTGSSQTISCQMEVIEDWGGIAGFQIVQVPEPGTLALAALGGIGMLALRRRCKSSR